MSTNDKLKIEFAGPEHGWLRVTLRSGVKEYKFSPSHVPYDSISELVNALLKIIDGYGNAVVHWNDEPVEHEFIFEGEGKQIHFKVYEIIESMMVGRVYEEVFATDGSLYQVVHPFWKALRDMQSKQSLAEYERQWREPFPEREMKELTQKIKEFEK